MGGTSLANAAGRAPARGNERDVARRGARGDGVGRMLLRALVVPLVIIALTASGLAWQISRLVSTTQMVDETDRTILQANQLLKLILESETGLRAYLLTDDASFIEPEQQPDLDATVRELEHLVSDD